MENRKQPEIRFSGFSDDWELRKVFDFSKETYGGGTPKTNISEYWEGNIPWIQSSDLLIDKLFNVRPKKYITDEAVKNSATKHIPANSIAIVTRVGVGKLALMPFAYTTSQDFLSLSDLQVDSSFGVYSLYVMLQKELNNIQGTSIKGVTKSDLLEKAIIITTIFEEQTKIGNFFKQLDDTITLHQRKLDLLKEQKKGFLQKMFPKPGANTPEVRFAGFIDDWEERKLGKITMKIGSGKTPRGGSSIYADNGIPLLRSQNIHSNRVNLNDVVYITEKIDEEMANSRVDKGDVLLNITGASIGRTAVYYHANHANVNQHVCIIRPNKNMNSDFIQLNLAGPSGQKQIDLNQAGGGREGLNFQQISTMSFHFPSLEEQQKIGSFFKQLDDTIALNQKELALLKETKKGFLQKMFV